MSRGTNKVAILIIIVVVFRISTRFVVVAVGIIIDVIFGFFVIGINDGVIIAGVTFGCRVRASGEGTVIIRSKMKKKMMIVAFEIIIYVAFGEVISVVVVVTCEGLTPNPAVRIIIVVVIDEAKGPIILNRRVMVVAIGIIIIVVFGIVIVVVVVVIVNYECCTLSGRTMSGVRVPDTAVEDTIVV